MYCSQKQDEDFAKFCGLLRIYELYPKLHASLGTQPEFGHNTYDSAFFQGKGDWNEATFKKNQEVMANLWNEIAELADFNKVN